SDQRHRRFIARGKEPHCTICAAGPIKPSPRGSAGPSCGVTRSGPDRSAAARTARPYARRDAGRQPMSEIEVHMFPCLRDNYGFLVHDPDSGATACVDTPEVEPILRALDERGWTLTYILNTHHHADHAGGNRQIKAATGCRIVGPRADAERIPGIDIEVGDGDELRLGARRIVVRETPGHTRGHIVYHFPDDRIAFVGDTLFAMGCGRLFEGTPAQMWSSLRKILEWPDDTRLYCAHEYTQANARFALTVEPGNAELRRRA